jgi:4'-phosphopantetheinyl transferase
VAGGSLTIDGGVRLAWAHPAEFDRARALRLLGAAERVRAAETVLAEQRDRFLLGRLLVRDLAADAGEVGPEEVSVTATCERCGGEHGRPRVSWPDAAGPPPSVSLASCRGLVVAALAPADVTVGVDVERPRAATSRTEEAERREAVGDLVGGPRRTAIRRWVRTEAVLKADGRGLRVEPAAVVFARGRAHLEDRPVDYLVLDRRIAGCLVSVAVGPVPR